MLDNSDFSEDYESRLRKIVQLVDKSQSERFKESARELGTDDDEDRFNKKLRKLAKRKPSDNAKPVIGGE